jgi:hypothetical protein
MSLLQKGLALQEARMVSLGITAIITKLFMNALNQVMFNLSWDQMG